MYLKALEIYGFKSFANKVKMPLKPGITCIVGPNGCGKSNVADSLRWCIGEMSWKSLRMPSMLDVIFSGTTRRKQLSMAEVSMTFDNSERKLPLDFSEVTVTRKIYRSEESEYFINKVQCRLKDIREMFLDTGIGTDGYAIIDQGQVERLLSASPAQRREMFEEAAGVSKYKAKRDEASRRLEKVEADLNRLSDSMVILHEQIKKLEAEARKARLQQKYRDELRSAEISLLLQEYKSFVNQADELKTKLVPLSDELNSLSISISKLEGECSALNLTLSQKEEELRKIREAAHSIKLEKNSLESLLHHNEQTLQDISGSKASLEMSKKANADKIARIEPHINSIKAKISSEQASLPDIKEKAGKAQETLSNTQKAIRAAEDAASAISSKINAAFSREVSLSQYLARSNADSSHLKESLAAIEKDRMLLEENAKKLKLSAEAFAEESSKLKEALAAEKTKAGEAEHSSRELSSEIQKADAHLNAIREETAACRAKLEALLVQAKKDSYWVGLNIVLKARIPGIIGSMRKLVKFSKADALAAEDSLGRHLDSVICENMEAAEAAIKILKSEGRGRCRFILLDMAKAAKERLEEAAKFSSDVHSDSFSVLNKISCDEKIKPLLQALLSGAYVSDGSVRGLFWLSGGAEKIISNEPYWGEETRLQDSLSALADESKAIINKKAELQPKLEGFRKAAELANSAALRLSLEIKDKENQARNANESLMLNKERIQLLAKNKERYEAELRKASESAEQFEKALSELKKESESLRNKKAGLDAHKERLHSEFALQKESFAISRAELENFNKNLESLRADLMRNEADFRSMAVESSHFDSRSRELSVKEEKVRESSASASIKLETLRDDLAKKEILAKQLDEEINALRLDYSRFELNLKDSRSLFAETERTKIKLETEMTSQQARGEETKQRLADAWEISVEEAEKNYSGQEADHERIVFLRRRVEAMGPVNMTAPEEHEALSQRYAFINSQAEDLNKAKSDLHSAIVKINDATRESFRITFDKVRSYFKEIYSLLFNGGESDLVLTAPNNLLETGIEIIARPPGKRPVSITQLSGGEKALTALSLLFSFFRVSPSPFCVMDETDAPLDEANVERFVKLIREFAPATQFLVITHNKRTMEAAETLYGVTMEELGVSKLVSVDLKHAEDLAGQKAVSKAS
ncbi:MAG: chromosome segregation protein SMC [Elusimicrobiales bacterium]|nr:chromosome segregation protein SMC [Elusimicrobiales bacterium]